MSYTNSGNDGLDAWLSNYSDTTAQTVYGGKGKKRKKKKSGESWQEQEKSLEKLIQQLSKLQSTIEENTGVWHGTGGTRTPAQMTSDILSGAAEGAKFGVFGNTAGAIGAGVGGLLGAFGVQGQNRYINAITGAAGIYETGAKQGVTVQNVVSGAAQGASLGSAFGPLGTAIGAGVGGLLDIFGGLFGHSKPAIPATQQFDPGLYNSPGQFDLYAQLYNLTGKYPNLPGQNFNQAANVVQLHFYSDGVQTAVQQQTSSATTRNAMTIAGAYYDHTRPQ